MLKLVQTDDHTGEVLSVSYTILTKAVPEGDNVTLSGESPEVLLTDMPMPYDPPGQRRGSDPQGFAHHWRQLHYVFDLPNPSLFPALPSALSGPDDAVVRRFIATTHDLAECSIVNVTGGFDVRWPDGATGEPVVEDLDLPARDLQAGFTALLRQCLAPNDEITVSRIHSILWQASEAATDLHRDERLDQLRTWSRVLKRLRQKSLPQLVRDRYVEEEEWTLFDHQEPRTPDELLLAYQYGDLLHWGEKHRDAVPADRESLEGAARQLDYLTAAVGLTHALIGFGELARAATASPEAVYLPA